MSATIRYPTLSSATSAGHANRAAAPAPSANPAAPALPASVVTVPSAATLRNVWLPASATYTLPSASPTIPDGQKNRASSPLPSVPPVAPTLPANVATVPSGATVRSVCPKLSDTTSCPSPYATTPQGRLNRATPAAPSAPPWRLALPASTESCPDGVMRQTVCTSASATATFPTRSTATPRGEGKHAAPFVTVVTIPSAATRRTA